MATHSDIQLIDNARYVAHTPLPPCLCPCLFEQRLVCDAQLQMSPFNTQRSIATIESPRILATNIQAARRRTNEICGRGCSCGFGFDSVKLATGKCRVTDH